jgi:hypothetical protein
MKKLILLSLLTLLSCQYDLDIEETQEERCNCYKGYYYVAGENTGLPAKQKPEYYSDNCNDNGIVFPEEGLVWTINLMVKCNKKRGSR